VAIRLECSPRTPRPWWGRSRQGEVAPAAACGGAGPHSDCPSKGGKVVRMLFAGCFAIVFRLPPWHVQRWDSIWASSILPPCQRGSSLPAPGAQRAAMRRLRVAQRRLCRRQKGSHRREKARLLLARQHERIRNLRHDHGHRLTRRLVSQFGLIAVENLNIRGLTRGFLARHIRDQGWAAFLMMLEHKAAEAGTRLVRVPPEGTSQTCSGC